MGRDIVTRFFTIFGVFGGFLHCGTYFHHLVLGDIRGGFFTTTYLDPRVFTLTIFVIYSGNVYDVGGVLD